jgi:protein-tyrosine phosphatase
MKDTAAQAGCADEFEIASAAVSSEETGNPVHHGTRRILERLNISCAGKRAVRMTKNDYHYYDELIAMDSSNVRNIERITGGDPENKIRMLLDRDVADPWYTGNFDQTYDDIVKGCSLILQRL